LTEPKEVSYRTIVDFSSGRDWDHLRAVALRQAMSAGAGEGAEDVA